MSLKSYAQHHKVHPTSAERVLWDYLQSQLPEYGFMRQYIILKYIVDFYCKKLRLVIEVDGSYHDQRKREDTLRENELRQKGYAILRFSNADVLDSPRAVIARIKATWPLRARTSCRSMRNQLLAPLHDRKRDKVLLSTLLDSLH